jgi:pyruvate dehydrogenase E2 component (dihydrolipoamide acetyltransferase)
MAEVVMPRLSDTMEEGTIVEWLAEEGAAVNAGDELVEIQTDKAIATYEAEEAGTLHIVAAVGDTVALGGVIAELR